MGYGCLGGSGGSVESVVIKNAIPDYLQDDVETYVQKSKNWSDTGNSIFLTDYNSSTYASQNINETDGIAKLITRATTTPTVITNARTLLQNNLDGVNLNVNTKSDSYYAKRAEILTQELEEEILPSIKIESSMLNMYGSSGMHIKQAKAAEQIAVKLLEISKEVYYDDYETNKTHQFKALEKAIDYAAESKREWELLLQAGYYKKEYTQGGLTDSYIQWRAARDREVTKLEILGNAIRATLGSWTKEIKPLHVPSPVGQIAGLAFAGAGLIASMYGSGMFGGMSNVGPTVANSGVGYNPLGGANSWSYGGKPLSIGK